MERRFCIANNALHQNVSVMQHHRMRSSVLHEACQPSGNDNWRCRAYPQSLIRITKSKHFQQGAEKLNCWAATRCNLKHKVIASKRSTVDLETNIRHVWFHDERRRFWNRYAVLRHCTSKKSASLTQVSHDSHRKADACIQRNGMVQSLQIRSNYWWRGPCVYAAGLPSRAYRTALRPCVRDTLRFSTSSRTELNALCDTCGGRHGTSLMTTRAACDLTSGERRTNGNRSEYS